jgi:hypothetical protein
LTAVFLPAWPFLLQSDEFTHDLCPTRQFWEGCKWIDPTDPRGLELLFERLDAAKRQHPSLRLCPFERLRDALIRLLDAPLDMPAHAGSKRAAARSISGRFDQCVSKIART